MNLSSRRSILPCAREAMRSLITRSADWSRPIASDGRSAESTRSAPWIFRRSVVLRGLNTDCREASREVDRVTEHIALALDHRPVVEADANSERGVADRRQLGDRELHLD